jgi:CBS domain containing-hemolysin-like protein
MTYDEVVKIIKSEYYSRYPVIRDSSVIGIFYVKTLTAYDNTKEFHIADFLMNPIFVTKTSSAYKLLNRFEKQHMHMAIVLGEYGEIAGLVTMEDILEEVVGDIKDEFDIFDDDKIKKSRNKYLEISGSVELDRLSDILNIDLTKEDIDTLNGLLIMKLGRLPKKGDKIRYKGFEFTVNSVEERVANKIYVRKI